MCRWLAVVVGVALAGSLAACADEQPVADPAGAGGGGAGGSIGSCLDPEDPAVHYQSDDHDTCREIVLTCEADQFGFDNACGCGCIDKGALMCPRPDDPEISWISQDPFTCDPEPPDCPLGQLGFSNSCGCGCILH